MGTKGKVEKEQVHLIHSGESKYRVPSTGWRGRDMPVWNLMSDRGGSRRSGRTLLPFMRKTKVPLAGGQENTFQVILIGGAISCMRALGS